MEKNLEEYLGRVGWIQSNQTYGGYQTRIKTTQESEDGSRK